jgi:hypothetical protein
MNYLFSAHALQEMERRRIPRQLVEGLLENPQQVLPGKNERQIYQACCEFEGGKIYLLRVIIDSNRDPPLVITVYRTSKIEKYWRTP